MKGVWASVCEPALPPEERSPRGYTSDRVLIDACRPYKWMDQFPAVNAFTKEFKAQDRNTSGKSDRINAFPNYSVKLGAGS